jgi:hypothetical protein
MRAAIVLPLLLLVLGATPARAQFPLAADLSFGGLAGWQRVVDVRGAGASGMLAVDLSLRRAHHRTWSAGIEGVGVGPFGGQIPEAATSSSHFFAATLGPEFSRGAGRRYVDVRGGLARLHVEASPDLDAWFAGARPRTYDAWGGAFEVELGLRAIPRPGPVGFRVAFRSSHAFTTTAGSHAFALLFGFAIRDIHP